MRIILAALCLTPLALSTQDPVQDPASVRLDVHAITDTKPFEGWIEDKARDAIPYVLEKLESHDVVLIGEHHEIRQNCSFVAELVKELPGAGVTVLFTEFMRSSREAETNALVDGSGDSFDEGAAIALTRELPWPTWGYQEYLEILRAAWRANHALPEGRPRLRVVGIDSDWNQIAHWKASRSDRFQSLLARERNMVATVEREALVPKRKAVVHCGWAHTITCQGLRLGTVLRKKYGRRIFQIALHHEVGAISPMFEKLLEKRGPAGFDIVGSPFAGLHDSKERAFSMLPNARLELLAEGWVYLVPARRLLPVTWIPGFIDEDRREAALEVARRRGWVAKDATYSTAAELDRAIEASFRLRAEKARQKAEKRAKQKNTP